MAAKAKKRTAPKDKKRREGHSALRLKDGKLETFDPHPPQRWRFVKDDDGHCYLIPADKWDDFEKWMEAGPYWEDYHGEYFGDYSIGSSPSNYTFTDPKGD